MADRRPTTRSSRPTDSFDQARNELFSHILRCGVLKAAVEHQKEWFDDTMDYLADRYTYLSDEELDKLRHLGEMYCKPVINRASDGQETVDVEAEKEVGEPEDVAKESDEVVAASTV